MSFPALCSREGAVGHVADQDVLERELGVALELAGRNASNEVPRLKGIQHPVDVIDVADLPQHLFPERLADDRGIEEAAANRLRKRVDARGDRRPDSSRQFSLAQALGKGTGQFFQEQRVPLGDLHDALDGRG